MLYFARENRELVNLDSCDLVQSQFDVMSDYGGCVALDYIAEVSEHLLPPAEPNEKFFRLLISVLAYLRENPGSHLWPAVNYFSLWAVKLSGFLPDIRVSAESRSIAEQMITRPIGQLDAREWTSSTARDLRRTLIQCVQEHVERRLLTTALLDTL